MFVIRPLLKEDIPSAAAIEKACFSMPWSEREIRESFENTELYRFFAAEEDGKVIGYASMSLILDEADIDNIAVLAEARKRGVGSALLAGLLRCAAENGASAAVLEVRDSNSPAIRLYEAFGFRQVGFRKNYYQNPEEGARIYGRAL